MNVIVLLGEIRCARYERRKNFAPGNDFSTLSTKRRLFVEPLISDLEPSPTQELAASSAPQSVISSNEDRRAAEVLIRHLFAPSQHKINGLTYDVAYALADGAVGGDIVDVYHFDNGNAALSIADIAGRGVTAAIYAALVKYGLRCYASEGLTAERVLRSLDRAYIENSAFERAESFASVFFGIVDRDRRAMTYASAGHEPVFLWSPESGLRTLQPTAPLIGVFDDQHHLFKQLHVELEPGAVLIATTDGVTEARNAQGEFFGMDLLKSTISATLERGTEPRTVTEAILNAVDEFTEDRLHDDIAVLAARID